MAEWQSARLHFEKLLISMIKMPFHDGTEDFLLRNKEV